MARILFIDDDWTTLHLYERACTILGHQPILAESGQQALATAVDQLPDLILLDRVLSDTDGFQVLQQLKQKKELANTPIIILSAGVSQQDKQDALNAGAQSYLVKPLNLVILKDLIYQYCS
jgi:DNA-binding response OmpR family regulator